MNVPLTVLVPQGDSGVSLDDVSSSQLELPDVPDDVKIVGQHWLGKIGLQGIKQYLEEVVPMGAGNRFGNDVGFQLGKSIDDDINRLESILQRCRGQP